MLTSRFIGYVAHSSSRQLFRRVHVASVPRFITTSCSFRDVDEGVPQTTSVAHYVLKVRQAALDEPIVDEVLKDALAISTEDAAVFMETPGDVSELEDITTPSAGIDDPVIEVTSVEIKDLEQTDANVELGDEDVHLTAEETLEIEEAEQLDCSENDVPLEDEGIDIDEMLLNSATDDNDAEYIEDTEEDYDEQGDDDIRTQVLSIALDHVPSHGWSIQSIDKAVELLDLSPAAAEMFKRGPLDLVLYFVEEANSTLTQHIAEQAKQTSLTSEKESADFIEQAIKTRLQMLIPYIDTWPQALKLMATPSACQDVLENGSTLMDEILYFAGDRSIDMSWYTRRAALAGIYCTTEVYMMNDKSADFQDTWAYLHRRMNDARVLNRAQDSINHVASDGLALLNAGVSTGITTMQNILGVGRRDR